jgi:hypothetical protein
MAIDVIHYKHSDLYDTRLLSRHSLASIYWQQ